MEIEDLVNLLKKEDQDELMDEIDTGEPGPYFEKYSVKFPITFENFTNIVSNIDDLEELKNLFKPTLEPALETTIGPSTSTLPFIFSEEIETTVIKFKVNVGVCVTKPVDLESVYNSLIVDVNIIAKAYYNHEPEYYNTIEEGIQKLINTYLYSEHSKVNEEKKFKKLRQNIVSFLFFKNDIQIKGVIADTGILSLDVYPGKVFNLEDVNSVVKYCVSKVICKGNIQLLEGTDIDIKFTYSTKYGYIPNKDVSFLKSVDIVNNIVKYNLQNFKINYSQNDYRLNFTVRVPSFKEIETVKKLILDDLKKMENKLKIRKVEKSSTPGILKIYSDHVVEIEKENLHVRVSDSSFDGIYKITAFDDRKIYIKCDIEEVKEPYGKYILTKVEGKKVILKKIREAGLVVKDNECEKKRRPEQLPIGDTSTGENIKEMNGNKFRCNPPYFYHGIAGSSNCCFKTKQDKKVEVNSLTIPEHKGKYKKTPLKKYTNMKKWALKILDIELQGLLDPSYDILAVADEPKDRTILECIRLAYGVNIVEEATANLSIFDFKKYFPNTNFEEWKLTESKSIDDILIVVSLHKKVTISIVVDTPLGLKVKCPFSTLFESVFLIYGKDDSYYVILNNGDHEHPISNVSTLLGEIKTACSLNEIKPVDSYINILKTQITDISDIVVFIEIKSGGYIPVLPSTVNSRFPVKNITDTTFILFSLEAQYNSLITVSKEYPELEPISLTKGLTSRLTTGIKLKNGGISPVSHSMTEIGNLPTDEELFYIERYSSQKDVFEDEEQMFTENLQKIQTLDTFSIRELIFNNNYNGLIDIVRPFIQDQEQLSRIVWYLINNI